MSQFQPMGQFKCLTVEERESFDARKAYHLSNPGS